MLLHEVVAHGLAADETLPAVLLGQPVAKVVDQGVDACVRLMRSAACLLNRFFFHGGPRCGGVSGIRILPAVHRQFEGGTLVMQCIPSVRPAMRRVPLRRLLAEELPGHRYESSGATPANPPAAAGHGSEPAPGGE